MTSLIRNINLPTPVFIHATGLLALGLYLTFRPPSASQKTTFTGSTSTLGIAGLGLELSYLATSYMPIAENQFLHASAPVRVILAAVAGVRLLTARPGECTGELWGILLYDGLGGLLVGWTLGRWDGRIPGY